LTYLTNILYAGKKIYAAAFAEGADL
jgi:hypothetical protein